MDEDSRTTREILAEAFAANDEFRRRDAESDRRLEQLLQRHQQTREMKRRNADGELRYRTQENARIDPPPQQQTKTMSDEDSIPWNNWLAIGVRKHLEAFAEELNVELDKIYDGVNRENRTTDGWLAKLSDRIQLVEEEIAALKCDAQISKAWAGKNVIALPDFLRKKTDAA